MSTRLLIYAPRLGSSEHLKLSEKLVMDARKGIPSLRPSRTRKPSSPLARLATSAGGLAFEVVVLQRAAETSARWLPSPVVARDEWSSLTGCRTMLRFWGW